MDRETGLKPDLRLSHEEWWGYKYERAQYNVMG
jgi:hypothetical protein